MSTFRQRLIIRVEDLPVSLQNPKRLNLYRFLAFFGGFAVSALGVFLIAFLYKVLRIGGLW